MHIVGFLGFKGAGKDTAASVLYDYNYDHANSQYFEGGLQMFEKFAFADPVKDMLAVTFGWDREMLDGWSEQSRSWRERVDPWWAEKLGIPHFTPRFAMTNIGTDVMRKHFHDNIWILSTLKRMEASASNRIMITDCRFPNEISMIRQMGGQLIRIQKGPLPEFWKFSSVPRDHEHRDQAVHTMETMYKDVHPSEWLWNCEEVDLVVQNDGTEWDMQKQVLDFVREHDPRS